MHGSEIQSLALQTQSDQEQELVHRVLARLVEAHSREA